VFGGSSARISSPTTTPTRSSPASDRKVAHRIAHATYQPGVILQAEPVNMAPEAGEGAVPMLVLKVVAFVAGAAVVVATFGSAIRTVILPRGIPARLGRFVFVAMRRLFRLRAGRTSSYEKRDRAMALYAPVTLLVLLLVWITLVLGGYTGMFWALGGRSLRDAFRLSGSSILTVGFERPGDLPSSILAFSEAALGLVLLALLITYLPTIYAAFSRREAVVTAMEVRAGSPPSGVEMLERYWRLEAYDRLRGLWTNWETWFVELEETHTSFPALVFFRSPQPDHSWVTAGGAILDAASLFASTVDHPREPAAEFCIRAGYLAFRRIADFFRIEYAPNPAPTDPISITRDEYDAVYDRLADVGVPLKQDRDQAWRDFSGWRINYDTVLLSLAALTMAPYAPWSSDRSPAEWAPSLLLRRGRSRVA
jgi:hypothetical protein